MYTSGLSLTNNFMKRDIAGWYVGRLYLMSSLVVDNLLVVVLPSLFQSRDHL